ncbi:hypothetical protein AB5J72_07475 [Streptomyces sp. CG1]|uniref:hypothetical protein n=1 Tax=Streptomyces sp. CG1 TaxID=1287523 RepID=UPI0034E2948B
MYVAPAHPAGTALPENLAVAAELHIAAVVAGAVMLPALAGTRGSVAVPEAVNEIGSHLP